MVDEEAQSCTLCGTVGHRRYLFEKLNDNSGVGLIKICRCCVCENIYLWKYNNFFDDELYAYYTMYAGKTKDQAYDPLTKESYLQVLKLLESNGGGRSILDVGCGNGSFVDAAMVQGYKIRGIDPSQSAVDVAQGFNLPVQNIDFFSGKIKESSFDVLTMFEVIEHVPEPVRFLNRAEHVVKPGGLIYITTPNFNSLDRRVLGKNWNGFHREHLTYFTPATLIKAISNNSGLEVLHAETRNMSGELITYIKYLAASFLLRDSCHLSSEVNSNPTQPDIRTRIAESPWLSLVKQGANFFLDATGLGSTVVILLKRSA